MRRGDVMEGTALLLIGLAALWIVLGMPGVLNL